MVEVTAANGTTLDRGWRERWAAAGRTAMAGLVLILAGALLGQGRHRRADVFVALAAELSRADGVGACD